MSQSGGCQKAINDAETSIERPCLTVLFSVSESADDLLPQVIVFDSILFDALMVHSLFGLEVD